MFENLPSNKNMIPHFDLELESSKGTYIYLKFVASLRDEDPEFFSTDPDPDPTQLKKKSGSVSGSGTDLKSK